MSKNETLIIKNKPKVEKVTKTDKDQKKLPIRNINQSFDQMYDQVKTAILENMNQRNLIGQTNKLVPKWIIEYLITKELVQPQYLLPIINWMRDKLISGNWTDTDARNIARLTRELLKLKFGNSIAEAVERELEGLDKYIQNTTQSTLDMIYEAEPEKEKEDKKPSK
jgi:hypothetical protein